MTAKSQAEYILTLRLDQSVSTAVLATELAQHIGPLIGRRKICGDVVVGHIEGDWSLEVAVWLGRQAGSDHDP